MLTASVLESQLRNKLMLIFQFSSLLCVTNVVISSVFVDNSSNLYQAYCYREKRSFGNSWILENNHFYEPSDKTLEIDFSSHGDRWSVVSSKQLTGGLLSGLEAQDGVLCSKG